MELDCQKAAAIFKALGDENRIHILQLLQSGEKCACRLLEELRPTSLWERHFESLESQKKWNRFGP